MDDNFARSLACRALLRVPGAVDVQGYGAAQQVALLMHQSHSQDGQQA